MMTSMVPFDHVLPEHGTKVVFNKLGNDYWQYQLRQVLEHTEEHCAWNELTEITIEFTIQNNNKACNVRGVRKHWDDINFHTLSKNYMKPIFTEPDKIFKKYQKECKEFDVNDLLHGESPDTPRPLVEMLDAIVCKEVIQTLLAAFYGKK